MKTTSIIFSAIGSILAVIGGLILVAGGAVGEAFADAANKESLAAGDLAAQASATGNAGMLLFLSAILGIVAIVSLTKNQSKVAAGMLVAGTIAPALAVFGAIWWALPLGIAAPFALLTKPSR